tara:strand:- start:5 stop:211 length:207 start_codon:yes stop_codon:yes gene_type:complete
MLLLISLFLQKYTKKFLKRQSDIFCHNLPSFRSTKVPLDGKNAVGGQQTPAYRIEFLSTPNKSIKTES